MKLFKVLTFEKIQSKKNVEQLFSVEYLRAESKEDCLHVAKLRYEDSHDLHFEIIEADYKDIQIAPEL